MQIWSLDELAAYAECALDSGARRLWAGQSILMNTGAALAVVASKFPGLSFGIGVQLVQLEHPMQAALTARTIAEVSGAPFALCVGVGGKNFQDALSPDGLGSPADVAARYIGNVRRMLYGSGPGGSEDAASGDPVLPASTAPPVLIGAGVLRERMAFEAGGVADLVLTWLAPTAYIESTILPALESGANHRGRARPTVCSVVHIVVERTGRDYPATVLAAVRNHLSADHYCAMLRRAGIAADPRSPAATAQALVESDTIVIGTPESIAQAVVDLYRRGVDEVVLNIAGTHVMEGPAAALADIRLVFDAVRELTDSSAGEVS
ncbi:LLM class flavin-dependent oxidoreductase [Nocardia sp. CA-290969]|uniref:LLM class flavin-dependent oxidoreductase n=1 Tax=Nocardia sp. CA-290969 TaxID=3239986 RepID=UPI003D903D49